MSSDRDDLRKRLGGLENRLSASDGLDRSGGKKPHLSEGRVRHLAQHLRALGRLNVYILAREWNCSPEEVVRWLTALHSAGRLERTDERPYFRVVSRGG